MILVVLRLGLSKTPIGISMPVKKPCKMMNSIISITGKFKGKYYTLSNGKEGTGLPATLLIHNHR